MTGLNSRSGHGAGRNRGLNTIVTGFVAIAGAATVTMALAFIGVLPTAWAAAILGTLGQVSLLLALIGVAWFVTAVIEELITAAVRAWRRRRRPPAVDIVERRPGVGDVRIRPHDIRPRHDRSDRW